MARIGAFCLILMSISLNMIAAQKKIVCYYGTWAAYRQGNGQFTVQNIDPNLCTHIVYTFFGIGTDGSVTILDPWLDLPDGGGRDNIHNLVALKQQNPKLKVMAAVGGWNEGSQKFSQVASNANTRAAFAKNALNFCKKYGFDGLDMDWEYPAQRDGNANIDKANFVLLLQELRKQFDTQKLLLSAAVAAAESSASISYDIPSISKLLDHINLMAYDLHGPWDAQTGYNAPLSAADQLNDKSSVQYWLSQGAPKEKLILGVPFYGHTYTLSSASQHSVGSPASSPGTAGPYTAQAGTLGYNEFCEAQNTNPWTIQWDSTQQVPYAYSGNQWISYDDPKSLALKAKFVVDSGLGGVMAWSIETDDFRGICKQGKYPLLNAIGAALGNKPSPVSSDDPRTGAPADPRTGTPTNPPTDPPTELPTEPQTNPPTPTSGNDNPPTSSDGSCEQNEIERDPSDCAAFLICNHNQKQRIPALRLCFSTKN